MPRKKMRLFTRHNSTKFVLYTEGRNEDGEKIKENVLIPVSSNHVPGSSLLIASLAGICKPASENSDEKDSHSDDIPKSSRKKYSETYEDEEADLGKILEQMTDSEEDTEDEEDFEKIRQKMQSMDFFDNPTRSQHPRSNVHVEIFDEEGSDFSDDFGQFSDAESGEDSGDEQPKRTLTSSRPDCPEAIKLLNEGFKEVLAKEYDENQIGALDDEEICGTFTAENQHVMNFISTPLEKKPDETEIDEFDDSLKQKILLYAEVEPPEKIVKIVEKKKEEFDCESILSTYTNIYNRPTVIKEESKIKKIKIPHNPLKKNLTKSQLKQLESSSSEEENSDDEDNFSVATSCNIRPKDETPEQRRERKNLFKEAKRESRRLKKENKLAFKNEKKKQIAQAINIQNTRGIKLL
ncbi:protein LTV1 homolog isoform X1 [Argiope bruennichi]|uniref:protein LTV1 homolog isoform X1 n=1 Tax=Argiope bruennichi TaxID=94029 RepID=UPI00249404F9|nr:protein LTV1 homolog isoform X1 [Argiope bruennichi]XP_055953768.1 protein LTV1 homolog isoform X1 [Argiope bruennichi]